MLQLGELHEMSEELASRELEVIALSNEEAEIGAHRKVLSHFDSTPSFPLLADISYETTRSYERTTAYYIDPKGKIAQVFPMEIYNRPPWHALFNEIDRLRGNR